MLISILAARRKPRAREILGASFSVASASERDSKWFSDAKRPRARDPIQCEASRDERRALTEANASAPI